MNAIVQIDGNGHDASALSLINRALQKMWHGIEDTVWNLLNAPEGQMPNGGVDAAVQENFERFDRSSAQVSRRRRDEIAALGNILREDRRSADFVKRMNDLSSELYERDRRTVHLEYYITLCGIASRRPDMAVFNNWYASLQEKLEADFRRTLN